jgi:predicted chitinase
MNYPVIAKACNVPVNNLLANWPQILACLRSLGIYSPGVGVAALATIAVETAWSFRPIHEFGGVDYLNNHYDTRTDLGNTPEKDGDGALYCGRGYIQITGKANYKEYGDLLGVDLVAHPERAMEPQIAAAILAHYFKKHNIPAAATAQNWRLVRKLVNGGTNGLADFLNVTANLTAVWTTAGEL